MSPVSLFLWSLVAALCAEILYRLCAYKKYNTTTVWKISGGVALVESIIVATAIRFFDFSETQFVGVMIALIFAWMIPLRFLPLHTKVIRKTPHRTWTTAWIIVALLAVLWGSWIRIAAVDHHVLQGDEYFHVNTGKGYLETGEFVQWDWLNDRPQENKVYTRAWPYSWQVAQSIRFFGEEEWALRLPALLWGIFFLAITPVLVGRMTRSPGIATFTAIFLAFDGTMVWLSVFSRMYTMLFVITLFAVYALWQSLYGMPRRKKHRERTRLLWLALCGVLIACGYVIHPVMALLAPCTGLIICIAWIRQPTHRFYQKVCIGMIAASIASALILYLHPIENLHFIIFRDVLETTYLEYFTLGMIVPAVAAVLFVGALVRLVLERQYLPPFIWMCAAIVLPVLLYFIAFANRYPAKKYFAFILVFVFVLFAWVWNDFWERLKLSKNRTIATSVFFLLWILIPFSLPGTDISWITTARAERSYVDLTEHDYPTLYQFLEQEAPPGSAFVLHGTKQYYLTRTDTTLYPITTKEPLTIMRIQQITAAHQHGYIVLSRPKKHLLRDDAVLYVEENFERVQTEWMKETNFILYRW